MRSGTVFTQGLRHTVGGEPAWTVEAVRQVRYHIVSADGLFEPGNTALLTGCPDTPLHPGDRRLVVPEILRRTRGRVRVVGLRPDLREGRAATLRIKPILATRP